MAKSQSNLNKQVISLTPDAIVDLYSINFSNLQTNFAELESELGVTLGVEPIYRFCPMINSTNPIFWQGEPYQPLPMSMEGFEHNSDGRLPRPKLRIANPEGLLSVIVHSNSDFANCKVTRKRTYARFLDDENFGNRNLNEAGRNPFGEASPSAHFPDDVFFINRKVEENKNFIEFELASPLELEGAKVPARIILSDYCPWKYRCSVGCGYKGLPVEDSKGNDLTSKVDITEPNNAKAVLRSTVPPIQEWKSYGSQASQGGAPTTIKGYNKGEVVKLRPTHHTDPTEQVFVCLETHSVANNHHPLFDGAVWAKDECTKSIDSCKSRFGKGTKKIFNPFDGKPEGVPLRNFNKSQDKGLPFGGFPSTERYDIQ
jgi:lambda family phage minor tail protein L